MNKLKEAFREGFKKEALNEGHEDFAKGMATGVAGGTAGVGIRELLFNNKPRVSNPKAALSIIGTTGLASGIAERFLPDRYSPEATLSSIQ